FDYPFGGVEVRNTRSIINLISRHYQGIQPVRTPEEVAEWLRDFHTALAQRLSAGETVLDMIPALGRPIDGCFGEFKHEPKA
ncbi:MAG: hypothetical protein JO344_07680, partial [Planctomycetaceae bacterium]|nr:hypothetical protein [Planctomycetaceae bacterium]